MTAIGLLDYAVNLLSGNIAPPVDNPNAGKTRFTILKFAQNVEMQSQKAWAQVAAAAGQLSDLYSDKYGGYLFTDQFNRELKEVVGKDGKFDAEAFANKLETSLRDDGEGFVFNNSHLSDFDNKNTVLGKQFDNLKETIKKAQALDEIDHKVYDLTASTIDPDTYWGHSEDVPHTDAVSAQVKEYMNLKNDGWVTKILEFVRKNPDRFNVKTVTDAIQNETAFISSVQSMWDDSPSINRAIREGDAKGTIIGLFDKGMGDTKEVVGAAVEGAGDVAFGDNSPLHPLAPFWDLLKDLWQNAGTYVEIVFFVILVFALLWVAGEIKTISS